MTNKRLLFKSTKMYLTKYFSIYVMKTIGASNKLFERKDILSYVFPLKMLLTSFCDDNMSMQ